MEGGLSCRSIRVRRSNDPVNIGTACEPQKPGLGGQCIQPPVVSLARKGAGRGKHLHIEPDADDRPPDSRPCEEPIIEPRAVPDAIAAFIESESGYEQEVEVFGVDDAATRAGLHEAEAGSGGVGLEVGIDIAHEVRGQGAVGPLGAREGHPFTRREGAPGEVAQVYLGSRDHRDEEQEGPGVDEGGLGFDAARDRFGVLCGQVRVDVGQSGTEAGTGLLFGLLWGREIHAHSLERVHSACQPGSDSQANRLERTGTDQPVRTGGGRVLQNNGHRSTTMRYIRSGGWVVCAGIAVGAVSTGLSAAPPRSLGQINAQPDVPAGSAPGAQGTRSAVVNGRLIFTASESINGGELWSSDGTEAGTFLLGDINPGVGSISCNAICAVGDLVFFAANDGVHGWELWATDGTREGTRMVKDVIPGGGSGTPMLLTDVAGTLFFAAADATGFTQRTLWKSDGTTEGTVLVRDFSAENIGLGGFTPAIAAAGNRAIFHAYSNIAGAEVWTSDGTPGGTVPLPEVWPGTWGVASGLVSTGPLVFYVGHGEGVGNELWRTDGTAAGTFMARDLLPGTGGISPQFMAAAGGVLYFRGTDANNAPGLYRSDGTFAGTTLVRTVDMWFSYSPEGPGVLGNSIYFPAIDGAGQEPWKSDGTFAGTVRIRDLRPGDTSSQPIEMKGVGGAGGIVYFSADVGIGRSLYKTNGTSAGTVLVKQFPAANGQVYHLSFYDLNGALLFTADDGTSGLELWRSDGTATGTYRVKDIRPVRTTQSASPGNPVLLETPAGPRVLFRASNGLAGFELWETDGTRPGTRLLSDTNAGPNGQTGSVLFSNPRTIGTVSGITVFTGNGATGVGVELHRVDAASPTGALLLRDIRLGAGDSSPESYLTVGGTLFFRADDGTSGIELWKTDGTPVGTVRVKDIRAGSTGSVPASLTDLGGVLIFQASASGSGIELWRSDGTEAGTVLVKDINSGNPSSNPSGFVPFNGGLVFSALGPGGRELWFTDGTELGTTIFADIEPGAASSSPTSLGAGPGGIVVAANAGGIGLEPWFVDGAGSPVNLADIEPGAGTSVPTGIVNADATWFFAAENRLSGRELWATDGTAAGTRMVLDIVPGQGSGWPTQITRVAEGLVAFLAITPESGTELWTSDGTGPGTRRASNIAPGALSAAPASFTAFAGGLLFAADDNQNGRELFLWRADGACPCDWNVSGIVEVADVFVFLPEWFAGNADYNQDGTTSVPDIFAFLSCFFECYVP